MAPEADENPSFPGFPDFRANVTFVPIQFFTVVVPHSSRGTVRIVGYALRKVLGWVDEHGDPTREQLQFTYRELIEKAGVSRECIADALGEALDRHFLRCIEAPRPHREGEPAQSGIYELCWDVAGAYTNRLDEFRGFYYPESAVMEDAAGAAPRAKAARKNIPNAFFDYLLPRAKLSVIRVVAALLFYSIQWGPGGERRVPVSRSITELSRLTRLTRARVHQAVIEAQVAGYIELPNPGKFDPAAGKTSRAATYAVRWAKSAPVSAMLDKEASDCPTVRNSERELDRSEKVNGGSVRKGERDRSEKVDGKRSKKVNGVIIKTDLKTGETATRQAPSDAANPTLSGAAAAGFQLLCSAGFDLATARRLAQKRSEEVIRRQIDWLPQRSATRNRLGFLRRAIEEDWPRPAGADAPETTGDIFAAARVFASHYYAAYHNFSGEPGTEPFPKDIEVAAKFVLRLLAQENERSRVPEWGRRFGGQMRDNHRDDPKAKPNLSFALVLYGDKFLRTLQSEGTTRRMEALGQAKEAHQTAYTAAYHVFLRLAETRLKQANAPVYEAFVEHRQHLRQVMTSGPLLVSAERLASFESDKSRLLDFAEFFRKHPQFRVPSFWEWDAKLNPSRFGNNAGAGASQEAQA